MNKIALVALGGNALIRGNQLGTIREQEENTYQTLINIIPLLKKNYNVVITHGNGPQVGNILLRNEAGYDSYKIPKMPLDICVADSQGGIGYMLERQLRNVLIENNIEKDIITIVTQVVVDKNDKAFDNPTKPIGKFFLKEEADLLSKANGWKFMEDPRRRGWRRIVPSPQPIDILNKKIIFDLVRNGKIVIAVGGGGIPIMKDDNNYFKGVEAVIDKDLASSFLASDIKADTFFILTDVPKVYLNFKKANEKPLDVITVEEANLYLEEGHFSEGSMAPKIQAAVNFINNGGNEVIITEASELMKDGNYTKIVKEK